MASSEKAPLKMLIFIDQRMQMAKLDLQTVDPCKYSNLQCMEIVSLVATYKLVAGAK